MQLSWLNAAGVSLLLPMVRKNRLRSAKTSLSVVSTRLNLGIESFDRWFSCCDAEDVAAVLPLTLAPALVLALASDDSRWW